ncbi:aldehyde dehydrogenase domain-containing protein [Dactylonectria estremocensis]|uniref:aldehyde dehydrogenase (NAD(+)) n=1 Tax=Dactylonectria estremocensis TaxID=1079267 RepID=A0A9P9DS37_9HYPO|nr:aldehyde dehydrogenase domain-containing protein [Dactylonectria estremocensis]
MTASVFADLVTPNGIRYRQPLGLFIKNQFVESRSGETISTIDPANEEEIARVHAADASDVEDAVCAAREAFEGGWVETPGTDRGRLLYKLADLIEQHGELLAAIESWDNGKPYSTAILEDLPEVVAVFRYYAGWADKSYGQVIETRGTKLNYTVAEPIGVCGQIIPWNYPIVMASWKLAPALAAGNTVVLKASEQTPLSALFLASLIKPAGFPAGVVNIINGYGAVAGAALASHLDVDKIAFTGSTQTGKEIMRLASSNLKSVTLETGGKSPLIVFNDADLHAAVAAAYPGVMGNAGQNCTANSRVLVQEDVYERFLKLFKAKAVSDAKIGDPFATDTSQGPQVTQAQFDRILSYVESGKEEGAQLIYGGKPHKSLNGKGFFIEPTIFTNVTPEMRIYREEIFGPFVVILPFKTESEVVQMANDTEYGLAAAVFTRDIARAHSITRKIKAGTVWINNSQTVDPRVPFGGFKQSGIGQEQGEASIKAYTNYKTVIVDLAPETHSHPSLEPKL